MILKFIFQPEYNIGLSLETWTSSLMIKFHQLKFPGKEIIKATTWGSGYNNLPPLVALNFSECMYVLLVYSIMAPSRSVGY